MSEDREFEFVAWMHWRPLKFGVELPFASCKEPFTLESAFVTLAYDEQSNSKSDFGAWAGGTRSNRDRIHS